MWEVLGFSLIPIGCDAPADNLGVLIILGMNIDAFDGSGGRGQVIFFPLGFTARYKGITAECHELYITMKRRK